MNPTPSLARRLGTRDAVVLGLASMIGAGVFSALAPAADVARVGLLIGVTLAAGVGNRLGCGAVAHPSKDGRWVAGGRSSMAIAQRPVCARWQRTVTLSIIPRKNPNPARARGRIALFGENG